MPTGHFYLISPVDYRQYYTHLYQKEWCNRGEFQVGWIFFAISKGFLESFKYSADIWHAFWREIDHFSWHPILEGNAVKRSKRPKFIFRGNRKSSPFDDQSSRNYDCARVEKILFNFLGGQLAVIPHMKSKFKFFERNLLFIFTIFL